MGKFIKNQIVGRSPDTYTINGNLLASDITVAATSIIDCGSNTITNVANPVNGQDVVTLAFLTTSANALNSIQQGDSNVTVNDAGTGSVSVSLDGTEQILVTPAATTISNNLVSTAQSTLGTVQINAASNISTTANDLELTSATNLVRFTTSASFSATLADQVVYTDVNNNVKTSSLLSFNDAALEPTLIVNGTVSVPGPVGSSNLTLTDNGDGSRIDANYGLTVQVNPTVLGGNNDLTLKTTDGIIRAETTGALKLPQGIIADRPATPEVGMMRYNNEINSAEIFDIEGWTAFPRDFVAIKSQNIVPDGVSSQFTLLETTTENNLIVSINGLVQNPTDGANNAYDVVGNQIIFQGVPLVSDIINIRYLAKMFSIGSLFDGGTSVTVSPTAATISVNSAEAVSFQGNSTFLTTTLQPKTDLTQNLGTASNRFNTVYANTFEGGVVISNPPPPATSTSSGTTGQLAYDASFMYVCVSTNVWVRSPLSTF